MDLSDIRVTLACPQDGHGCLAYVSAVFFSSLVIHDIKVIQKANGQLFVSMPSRQVTDRCEECGRRNPLKAAYCQHCGFDQGQFMSDEPVQFYVDVVHPVNNDARLALEKAILDAYRLALDGKPASLDNNREVA